MRPGIETFKPSVTGKAWGKTGARTAGGVSTSFVSLLFANTCRCSPKHRVFGFAIPFNCYNFTDQSLSVSEPNQRHEMSFLRICE